MWANNTYTPTTYSSKLASYQEQKASLSAFLCPITHQKMAQPVIDQKGNSFQRSAIENWVTRHHSNPLTKDQMTIKQLKPNRALQNAIHQYDMHMKQKNLKMEKQMSIAYEKIAMELNGSKIKSQVEKRQAVNQQVRKTKEKYDSYTNSLKQEIDHYKYHLDLISKRTKVLEIAATPNVSAPFNDYFNIEWGFLQTIRRNEKYKSQSPIQYIYSNQFVQMPGSYSFSIKAIWVSKKHDRSFIDIGVATKPVFNSMKGRSNPSQSDQQYILSIKQGNTHQTKQNGTKFFQTQNCQTHVDYQFLMFPPTIQLKVNFYENKISWHYNGKTQLTKEIPKDLQKKKLYLAVGLYQQGDRIMLN